MEALYHQTNNLVQETQSYFAKLERCTEDEAEALERKIQGSIDTITSLGIKHLGKFGKNNQPGYSASPKESNCEKLDILVYKDPISRRQTSKSRVDQLKYDNQHLQAALRMLQHKRRKREMEEKEREELLKRKFTTLRDEEETAIFIDHSIQHQDALHRANRNLDDLISTGSGVLENLREQRLTLKGAHKRLIDLGNTLGLSNTTMRLIENRVREDKWILLGGMFITMVIVFIVIIYIKK